MTESNAPHWDLSLLYTFGSPELERDLRRIQELGESFPLWRKRLEAPDFSAAELSSLLADLTHIQELSSKISGYSPLFFSEDTSSQRAQSFVGAVDARLVELENALLFFQHWWKGLGEERAQELMKAAPELKYYLTRIRAFRPYTLSEAEERVVNYKDVTGSQALVVLYYALTNRLRFKTDFLPNGGGGRFPARSLWSTSGATCRRRGRGPTGSFSGCSPPRGRPWGSSFSPSRGAFLWRT